MATQRPFATVYPLRHNPLSNRLGSTSCRAVGVAKRCAEIGAVEQPEISRCPSHSEDTQKELRRCAEIGAVGSEAQAAPAARVQANARRVILVIAGSGKGEHYDGVVM